MSTFICVYVSSGRCWASNDVLNSNPRPQDLSSLLLSTFTLHLSDSKEPAFHYLRLPSVINFLTPPSHCSLCSRTQKRQDVPTLAQTLQLVFPNCFLELVKWTINTYIGNENGGNQIEEGKCHIYYYAALSPELHESCTGVSLMLGVNTDITWLNNLGLQPWALIAYSLSSACPRLYPTAHLIRAFISLQAHPVDIA